MTVVIDAYQSSIHSDAMDTCMMQPHAAHALREAGFTGRIVKAGQAGLHELWAKAVGNRAEALVAEIGPTVPVSVHLVQHGSRPGSQNPCGAGPDQYHENARREYELSSRAVAQRFEGRGNVTLRHVYAQGAGNPDDGVLSPPEALQLDQTAGIRSVIMLPFEFWGDGVDTLVYFREGLGFEPASSPYYDDAHETRFTQNGIDVRIASGSFGTETKAEAQLVRIAEAIGSLGERA